MSSIIKILPDHVINKIAAGEVVERPASVVKELVENSIDAGATEIHIDIEESGRRLIRLTDNGSGMSKEDARTAFLRHATSKISDDTDLESIRTMGFRGEALSSIASVSHVRLQSAMKGATSGALIEIEGGMVKTVSEAAAPQGTVLEISHLFFNTPARRKFLKSPATEFSHIMTAVSRQAMAHPSVRFRLTHNKKTVLELSPSGNLRDRTLQLYGEEIAENLIEFAGGDDRVHVHGLIGRPGTSRADKTYQEFFVNRRAVKNASLTHALYSACGDTLMRDRHPVAFIFIEIDPTLVDVNVHPAKAEVRFRNQSQLHDLVRDVIREGLRGSGEAVRIESADRVREAIADFGMRNAGRPLTPTLSPEGRGGFSHPLPLRERTEVRGGAQIDSQNGALFHSALLYPLAQIHDSFIIAQSQEGMALIDQHAAHERVLFERLQDQFGAGRVPEQHLLVPDQVELGPAQSMVLAEYLPELSKLGFLVEDFGNGTFVIKAVPALLVGADTKQLLLDILDEVNVHGKSGRMDEVRDEMLSVMACHPAIKVHRHLDQQEMEKLLADLFKCRMPHTCPHGRPTIVRFSLVEIMKMFKRM
ncbi:MAG: DNA mismatch repair endonuclease MutL [Nitrospirae bacterium]|nr:DNA mismatch repair endonuclease MutL [Nitrospirota bacterium]